MSSKYMHALQDIAHQLDLSFHQEMQTIYGEFNDYKMVLLPSKETQFFTLKLSLKEKGELPNSESIQRVIDDSKVIKNSQVQGHLVHYVLKAGRITKATTGEKLKEALDRITQFLKTEQFTSCCQDCGIEGAESFYNVSGIPTICCEDCFKLYTDELIAMNQVEEEKQDNFVAGLVGALLGSLVGVAAIVLLGQLGFVSALSGLLMAVCSLKGYELLGGKLTNKGMITTGIIMVMMVYFGTRLDWAISIARFVPEASFVMAFRVLPELISEGFIEGSDFYFDLTLVYVFTALGAIPTIIAMRKNKKAKYESYRMSA